MSYLRSFNTRVTPQSQPILGVNQVQNNAGGYVFGLDIWKRLDRFLILGAENGTFYVSERALTQDNAKAVAECIKTDGIRTVNRIVEISESGRAPKNDPALFALAMAAGLGDPETRKAALTVLPRVARIGTHLFHFAGYVEGFRGWGRGLRTGISNWYLNRKAGDLAFDAVKYQQRDGWGHRDLVRLSHPVAKDAEQSAVLRWIAKDEIDGNSYALAIVRAYDRVTRSTDESEIIGLVTDYRLPMEAIPTEKRTPNVLKAVLPNLGMTALIRSLGTLSKNGVLAIANLETVNYVTEKITDAEALKRARVHPIAVLAALKTYSAGHGFRGSNTWNVVPEIVDALNTAFYNAFGSVQTSGKNLLLALDVSGSMGSGSVSGVDSLTPREAAAAMAMVTYKTEKNARVVGFGHQMEDLGFAISRARRLDDVVAAIKQMPFGGTDCALPMVWALKNHVNIDTFVIYTDNETWYGQIHPVQALAQYRQATGNSARLIVVGMTSTGFSIADPNDAGTLDVVGFDTATPELITQFAAGNL